jgi:hypothetical protein
VTGVWNGLGDAVSAPWVEIVSEVAAAPANVAVALGDAYAASFDWAQAATAWGRIGDRLPTLPGEGS